MWWIKNKKIVTHSSRFHADDLFACATLRILFPSSTIVRSRDMAVITSADIVVDVGGEYDPLRFRFDHHQKGGAGLRPNGVPYAAFGLVWKHFGPDAIAHTIRSTHLDHDESLDIFNVDFLKKVADKVEERLVWTVDSTDNGISAFKATTAADTYEFDDIASVFGPTWQESKRTFDDGFFELLPFFTNIVQRQILRSLSIVEAENRIDKAYATASDKRLLVLDKYYPLNSLSDKYPELLFIVSYDSGDKRWKLSTVRISDNSFESRKLLPASWAGLRDSELAKASGVSDALFCHNARFLAVAQSKEGILKMADIALLS